jgi:hypothetical protein
MKKMMLSGLVLLTAAMGSVAQASPTTNTASAPTLPVVAGATALSQAEKAGVQGNGLRTINLNFNVYLITYIYAYGNSSLNLINNINIGGGFYRGRSRM